MDHQRVYDAIIFKWRNQAADGYTESHHIVPRCLGGTDNPENLVRLPARAHFVAHLLLARIHGGKLVVCAWRMSGMKKYGSRKYHWLRSRNADAHRGNKHSLGFRPSAETRGKLSALRKGKKRPPSVSAKLKGRVPWNKGKRMPPDSVEAGRLKQMGRKPSQKSIESLRARSQGNEWGRLGKGIKKGPMSEEQKARIASTMRRVRAEKKWISRI